MHRRHNPQMPYTVPSSTLPTCLSQNGDRSVSRLLVRSCICQLVPQTLRIRRSLALTMLPVDQVFHQVHPRKHFVGVYTDDSARVRVSELSHIFVHLTSCYGVRLERLAWCGTRQVKLIVTRRKEINGMTVSCRAWWTSNPFACQLQFPLRAIVMSLTSI